MAERKISRKVSFNSNPLRAGGLEIPSEDNKTGGSGGNQLTIPHYQKKISDPIGTNRFQVAEVKEDESSSTDADSSLDEEEDEEGGLEGQADNNNELVPPGSEYSSYVSRYSKSLGQLTDVLPRLDNFREHDSIQAQHRPTMDELHHGEMIKAKDAEKGGIDPDDVDGDGDPTKLKGKVIKFGWLEGVLMRCLLNIWGVLLFIRLSWVIGQAGILQGILVVTWANATTFITAISMSAVSTNGQIKGGGIYYMISRSLGPEFGAAIGLLFTIANSIAVALHIVGFCEAVNDLLKEYDFGEIIDGGPHDTRIIGTGLLICILVLVFVGMDWVTRTQMLMLVILIAAQVAYIVGSIIGPNDDKRSKGFVGFNWEVMKENLYPKFGRGMGDDTREHTFFTVFGVYFPAVTGIVAGANLSGDLKDPASAIPKGTLLAIGITYLSYIIYGAMLGASTVREASGNHTDYLGAANFTPTDYDNVCVDKECSFGLLRSAQVMALISSWGPLIYMGGFAASISSAIASLVGAPRVLMALAKDKLYPKIHFFATGYGANNDPVRGYVLVFIIALGCVLIADLNAIAPLLSNIFLAAYCLINFSCFHASITKSAGWRPAFKYYNAWLSLLGSVMCISAMFLMNWMYALVTIVINIILYLYVTYKRKPNVNWGSSTQAQSYNSALKSTQELVHVQDHVKNYRPQILVLSGLPSSRPALVDIGHLFIKHTSLMICGHVVKGTIFQRERNTLTKNSYAWLDKHGKKGFYTLIEADSIEEGAISLMQTVGLGKLKPNMVLMGFKHDWNNCGIQEMNDYFRTINEALHLHLAIGILRVKGGLDYSGIIEEEGQMTVEQVLMESRDGDIAHKPLSEEVPTENDEARPGQGVNNTVDPAIEATTVDETETQKKKKSRKISVSAIYQNTQPGKKKPTREILNNVVQFRRKHTGKTIDVWWMYDDGGLTLLLPYLLTKRKQYAGCQLRIFSLAPGGEDALGHEQRSMATLLAKLRIDYSDVIVISDDSKNKVNEAIRKEFDDIISPFQAKGEISSEELKLHKEKTNRHLRLREHLLHYSKDSAFVAMTMLIPRKGSVSPALYLAWLELLTRNMPPFLLTRGNQTSVFTFYA